MTIPVRLVEGERDPSHGSGDVHEDVTDPDFDSIVAEAVGLDGAGAGGGRSAMT